MRGVGRILVVIMLAALFLPGAVFAADKIVITFADHNAIGSILNQAALRFKAGMEKETSGKVEVRYFPASQMGNERENIESVKLGMLNMCYADPPYLSNLAPEFSVMGLPFIFRDWKHVEQAMDGAAGKKLAELLLKKEGLRILGWQHVGFRNMLTVQTPIDKMADFKGLKFRSPEVPVFVKMFKAIGASPTPIPWGEVYTAMKTKIVDGMETTTEAMVSVKLYEVGKNVIVTNHMNTQMTYLINDKFYQGLPMEVKTAMGKVLKEVIAWQRGEMIKTSEAGLGTLKEKGCTVTDLDTSEMAKACTPVWSELTKGKADAKAVLALMPK
jgi:tripartite ATP-independent transporter DctP family solute receptor